MAPVKHLCKGITNSRTDYCNCYYILTRRNHEESIFLFQLVILKNMLVSNTPNQLHIGPDSVMPQEFQKVTCLYCNSDMRNTSLLNENFKSLEKLSSPFLENFTQYSIYQTIASEIKDYMNYSQVEIQRNMPARKQYHFILLTQMLKVNLSNLKNGRQPSLNLRTFFCCSCEIRFNFPVFALCIVPSKSFLSCGENPPKNKKKKKERK